MDSKTISKVRKILEDLQLSNGKRIQEYQAAGGSDNAYLEGKAMAYDEVWIALSQLFQF